MKLGFSIILREPIGSLLGLPPRIKCHIHGWSLSAVLFGLAMLISTSLCHSHNVAENQLSRYSPCHCSRGTVRIQLS